MPRPEKFTTSELLDAAREAVAAHGRQVTLAQIATQAHAPIGSLYHRFASREELLAQLWLRSIGRFHTALLAVIEQATNPHEALVETAVAVGAYCRANPSEAEAMTLYRQAHLAATGPETLREQASHINDAIFAQLAELTYAHYGRANDEQLALVRTAVVELPYGLLRPCIGAHIPDELDRIIRAATSAVLNIGQQHHRQQRNHQ